jgi:uncharacterized protein YkwD
MAMGCTDEVPRGQAPVPIDPEAMFDGGSSGAGQLCSPCQLSTDCLGDENLCLQNNTTQERFCGRRCDSASPCPSGYRCLTIEGYGTRQCIPKSFTCLSMGGVDGGATPPPSPGQDASVAPPPPPPGQDAAVSPPPPKPDASTQKTPPPPPKILGPCGSVPMAVGPTAPSPPSVYGGKWTPAPTKGCSFVDGEGRTVTLTDVQHRMLYRTNEVRALQSAADGVKRATLEADFCLQEFSQGYAETKPGGHSKMNTHLYKRTDGKGYASGGKWIGENLHMHSGSKYKDRMSSVDAAIVGWWNSGSTTTGHRGNMLNPKWGKGGMGVYVTSTGSTLWGIQTFSRDYANWTWGWTPCTNPPKVNNPDSTVPGAGYVP